MKYCFIPIIFAYMMMTYLFASIFYLIFTKSLGSPFSDELRKPENEKLYKLRQSSSKKRERVFLIGVVLAVAFLLVVRPFNSC